MRSFHITLLTGRGATGAESDARDRTAEGAREQSALYHGWLGQGHPADGLAYLGKFPGQYPGA